MVRYAILGPVELCDGERRVSVAGPRQVALLALLLLSANRVLSSDRLIDVLWPERDPAGSLKRLQVVISRLRRTLDPPGGQGESLLRTVAGGYLLEVAPGELDAQVFENHLEEGRRALRAGDAARAREMLCQALGMWRGPALAGVAYERFAQPEIRRLEELRLAALEARVDCELGLGEHAAVVAELDALVAAHPGREHLALQLMLALYRCGRQGDALAVYARTRAYLSQELGLEPGPALQELQAQVLAQSPALQPVRDEPGLVASESAAATDPTGMLPTGVVTFLLTDIEGSTRLWDSDPDAMAVALEHHDKLIARLAARHGGRLLKDKGEGDATLSVFQRASGAVACAAELQRGLSCASWPAGLALRVRVALHSGEAQERDSDYFGPVLNRAARLRSLAGGGVTVLSQSTAELVRDRLPEEHELVDVGRHELRGVSRPERVFELRPRVGDAAARDGAEPVLLSLPRSLHAPPSSPFVGRDAELACLREQWAAVRGGARSAIVIGGEPGIGKTRLASELAREVHEQGALVLYGRCDEGLAVPYQPFVEALGAYARAAGVDRLRAELGDLAPELGRLLPELVGLGEPVRAAAESERFALFEAVAALVEAITRERTALLVLDDLHWAANPTLLLLRHLIRSERRLGALVLCTYRETELDLGQLLAQLLADLQRDVSVQRVRLGGLDEPAIAALVTAAVGHQLDELAGLAQLLGAQTAGNPFFVHELLADLAEAGTISRAGEGTTPAVSIAQLQAPEGLRHVIVQRVARLSSTAGRVLSVAAVAGPTFSFVLLERVLGEASGVLDALDEAVAAGLLAEAGHGDYAFAHALVRQTIYQELGAARRMRLHRQLGESLETLDDMRAHIDALAYHFAQAAGDGQGVKAADYALAAGRHATARLGHEDAAAHYERGLEALTLTGQPHEQRRCELLLALGQARWDAGELDGARQACEQAAGLAEQLQDPAALARAALGFCGPPRTELVPAVIQSVAALLQRALRAIGEDDSALRARLIGRLTAYTDVEQRPLVARQAVAMARRVDDNATLADVLASTHWATRGPDALHESLAMNRELRRVAYEVGDRQLQAAAHARLLEDLLEIGDIDGVQGELQALQRLMQTRTERFFRWFLALFEASHAHLQGRVDEGETLARAALAHRFEGRDELASRAFGVQMFFLRREQGRLDEHLEVAEGLAAQYHGAWHYTLAYIYAQLNRPAQAREQLEATRTDDLPRDVYWLANLSVLCEVVAFLGDAPRAQRLYKLLLPYADRCIVVFALLCQGSASRLLGLLATTLSQLQEAERHFEHALTMNAQIRSPLWIAHTQHDYARMLLLRDRSGDRDKALELLTDALATAQQLGLTALADKARPLKLEVEAKGPAGA